MFKNSRISLVVPCLNEAAALRQMLPQVPVVVDEVVVVDNGSTDDSSAIALANGARVVTEARRGYGSACLRGLREASGDVIIKVDGDCTYPLDAIEGMVRVLTEEGFDFVSGSRFPLQKPAAMSWRNRVGNWLLTTAANRCFGLRLADSLSGMWAVRKAAAERIALTQPGIPFSQEIKIEAFGLAGLRSREVWIPYHRRVGASKLMPLRDGLACFRFLLGRRWRLWQQQRADLPPAARISELIALLGLLAAAVLFPLSPALKNVTLGVAVLAWLANKIVSRSTPRWTQAYLPFLLWCLVGMLSVTQSVSVAASVRGLVKILSGFVMVLMVADTIRTHRRLWGLFIGIMVGAAIVSLDGLVQVIFGIDVLRHHVPGVAPGGIPRLTGPFGHANDFGIYAVGVLPACLVVALAVRSRWSRWISWTTVGVLSMATILAFSRTALLGLAVSLTILLMVRRAWKTFTLLGIFAVLGLVALPPAIREWAISQGSWFDMLVQPERPQIWWTAINMIKAHPLTGVGLNTFVLNYARYKAPGDYLQAVYAHNHYLHMAAEIGLVGLAVFAWLLVRTARVWRVLLGSRDSWVRSVSAGAACGLIGFLTAGLLESALQSSHTNFSFWLWLGVLHGLGSRQQTVTAPQLILFVRTDRLGETLLNLPLLAALKQAFPQAVVTWLVNPELVDLLTGAPGADQVVAWRDEAAMPWWQRAARLARWLRGQRFDVVVVSNPKKEYHLAAWLAGIPTRVGYDRKWAWLLTQRIPDRKAIGERHEIEYNLELLRGLGIASAASLLLELPASPDEELLASQLFEKLHVRRADRLVAVHPWTSNPKKQWPVERFRQLLGQLCALPAITPVVVGGNEEWAKVGELISGESGAHILDTVGKLSLKELAALLRRVRVLVSNDSGPMHLAASVGTPVIALFGTAEAGSVPHRWGPWGDRHTVIHKPLAEITVDEVVQAVRRYLGQG